MTRPGRLFAAAFLLLLLAPAQAQIGGSTVFRVLDIPSSARVSALGGSPVPVYDNDLNLGLFNPALLNASMSKQVSVSWLPYIDGINVGYAAYGHHLDSARITLSGSAQYVDYGSFTRRDGTGMEEGSFSAGEYVVQVGAGRALDSVFSVGVNLKFITSHIESYNATGWAADIGGVFVKKALGLTVGATLRNIGMVASSYTGTKEMLPFQAQVAATYKFRHAPFRLGLSVDNVQQWDLTYEDPNKPVQLDPVTGEAIEEKVTMADKALLHLVPNAEILLSPNFMLRFGYDMQRRRELAVDVKPGLAGLSLGIGLRISRIHLSYSYAQFNPAGASNTFTLAMRFSELKRSPAQGRD
ncbi:MAG: type IX secretion system protein PorQ [Flavobacteriales bacterium]|nr:type IX secretion system protein PorQ [Flavobacteriales bacterium]MCL4281177.1 type IX secretion system protein PorQ [Flavobacteriales bacterium]